MRSVLPKDSLFNKTIQKYNYPAGFVNAVRQNDLSAAYHSFLDYLPDLFDL
jgi:homoserine kinase